MKPFARLEDRYSEPRTAPAQKTERRLERVWIKKNGKLECHYEMRAR